MTPQVDLPLRPDGKLDVGAAVGQDGTLTVIRDLNMKEPYVGSVGLLGGEIAEDLAAYFVESEQIPTACGLGVLVDRDQSVLAAGGYLIQLLPGAGEDTIAKVEGSLMAAGAVTGLLRDDPDPEAMLRRALSDFDLEILEKSPIEYRCYCSRERMERALISLGAEELQSHDRRAGQRGPHLPLLRQCAALLQRGPGGHGAGHSEKKAKKLNLWLTDRVSLSIITFAV